MPTNLNKEGKKRDNKGPFFETNDKAGKEEDIIKVNNRWDALLDINKANGKTISLSDFMDEIKRFLNGKVRSDNNEGGDQDENTTLVESIMDVNAPGGPDDSRQLPRRSTGQRRSEE